MAPGSIVGFGNLLTGEPYIARLAFGFRRPRNPVPGMDMAGTVERVGAGVAGFAAGDEVFGIGKGAYAEFAVAPTNKLVLSRTGWLSSRRPRRPSRG